MPFLSGEIGIQKVPIILLPLQQRFDVFSARQQCIDVVLIPKRRSGTLKAQILSIPINVMVTGDGKDALPRHLCRSSQRVKKIRRQRILSALAGIGEIARRQDEIC